MLCWSAACGVMLASAAIGSSTLAPCVAVARMSPSYRGETPAWFLLTLNAPGADYSANVDADDVGPPEEVKRCMDAASGANVTHLLLDWRVCEPAAPETAGARRFVWEQLAHDVARVPPGRYLLVSVAAEYRWDRQRPFWADAVLAADEAAWWQLFEGFLTAAARELRRLRPEPEDIYYHPPGNEMSLTGKPDWAHTYMKPVKHWHAAVKRADARNRTLVGALVVGDRGHIGALYEAGLKGNFDALHIHNYDDSDGKSFLSMAQIIESHRVLEEFGDGDKRIWLGEGWSPFPLPRSIDGREEERHRQGLGMSTEPYTYTEEEIEHYRKSVIRGWYNLMTPRATYNPRWVLGASYFCLNDMWGAMGWSKRAVPKYDAQGNIEAWDLDGYHIPYKPFAMEPVYRPWGLIDAHGWPKGDIIVNFPPYLPRHEFAAAVAAEYEGHAARLTAGQPHVVTLRFTSDEDAPYRNCRFGMDTRERNRHGVIFEPLDDPWAGDLARGQTVERRFAVTFPAELVDQEVCVIGELHYTWAERIPYYASAWLDVLVTPAARQYVRHAGGIAAATDAPLEVGVTLHNPTASIFRASARARGDEALEFLPAEHEINLHAGESVDVTFAIRLRPYRDPGLYSFVIDTGQALRPIQGEAIFAPPPRHGDAPGGLLYNGDFEQANGERGHRYWSGDASNWDSGDVLKELPDGGLRCLTYAANGVTPTYRLGQVVPWPGLDGRRGGLRATAAIKGVGFELDAVPADCGFRLRLSALDGAGRQLEVHESPLRKGTGGWDRLEWVFPPPPDGTAYLRFEIETSISQASGWHFHYVDNVALTPQEN